MQRVPLLRLLPGALVLMALLAPVASAQEIPAGNDYWTTRPTGNTFVVLPDGEVEALCGAAPDPSWDHLVRFVGVPVFADADTIVRRLDAARFSTNRSAQVRVQVTALHFRGMNTSRTPCGDLAWEAVLSQTRQQPVTTMVINRANSQGGRFSAKLSVEVDLVATDVTTGVVVGTLPLSVDLPDTATGTVWSYGGVGGWRPAVDAANNCFAAARAKVSSPTACPPYCLPPSQHEYWIAQYQALGICPPNPH